MYDTTKKDIIALKIIRNRVDMYKISTKKSSSNINTLSNDPTSIIIYRKRRYEHVYDYNKVFLEFLRGDSFLS